MQKLKNLIPIIILLSIISLGAYAQGPGFDDDVTDAPLDGGVCALVVAGAAYGVKKIRNNRKRTTAENN